MLRFTIYVRGESIAYEILNNFLENNMGFIKDGNGMGCLSRLVIKWDILNLFITLWDIGI